MMLMTIVSHVEHLYELQKTGPVLWRAPSYDYGTEDNIRHRMDSARLEHSIKMTMNLAPKFRFSVWSIFSPWYLLLVAYSFPVSIPIMCEGLSLGKTCRLWCLKISTKVENFVETAKRATWGVWYVSCSFDWPFVLWWTNYYDRKIFKLILDASFLLTLPDLSPNFIFLKNWALLHFCKAVKSLLKQECLSPLI